MDSKPALFKADRNQLIALIAMLGAVSMFAIGEVGFGAVFFVVAAAFSLGGLFWSAHRQDQRDRAEIAELKKSKDAPASRITKE